MKNKIFVYPPRKNPIGLDLAGYEKRARSWAPCDQSIVGSDFHLKKFTLSGANEVHHLLVKLSHINLFEVMGITNYNKLLRDF